MPSCRRLLKPSPASMRNSDAYHAYLTLAFTVTILTTAAGFIRAAPCCYARSLALAMQRCTFRKDGLNGYYALVRVCQRAGRSSPLTFPVW